MNAPDTPDRPAPYGYLATLGWALLAAVISTAASGVALYLWYPNLLQSGDIHAGYNGQLFARVLIPSNIVQIAVLAWAAWLRRWPVAEYLGFRLASGREVAIGVACLAAWLVFDDTATHLLGKNIVTPFQSELYTSARAAGALPLLWIALVLVGPLAEEVMFRGFLYRGWARSPRSIAPAILVISALWAVIHVQYDWFGIFQVFLTGLLFGWIRWRSHSTALTFLLHGLMNAWATVETIIALDWLS